MEDKDHGAHVIVVSKSKIKDHIVLAKGGINAALGTMDPQEMYI
jgi:hypothetical protein